ncbi:hypothetical protein, partial [Actinoplanes sp. TFC3]|uniref:hypothetical protein n=1 Tax=Actinoplanes sp. TFC3 TaxID=1710355 RepID=UPI001F454231
MDPVVARAAAAARARSASPAITPGQNGDFSFFKPEERDAMPPLRGATPSAGTAGFEQLTEDTYRGGRRRAADPEAEFGARADGWQDDQAGKRDGRRGRRSAAADATGAWAQNGSEDRAHGRGRAGGGTGWSAGAET